MSTLENSSSAASTPPRKRRRLIIAGSAIAVLAAVIAVNTLVFAHGRGHRGWGGPMAAEQMAEHLDHAVKYVLSDIDATNEQKAQITSIVQAAGRDVHAMHDQHAAGHQQLKEILSAPTIDRARLETLRADQLRLADEASKRVVTALADAADQLTPEQRSALARRMEEHHRHLHGNEK